MLKTSSMYCERSPLLFWKNHRFGKMGEGRSLTRAGEKAFIAFISLALVFSANYSLAYSSDALKMFYPNQDEDESVASDASNQTPISKEELEEFVKEPHKTSYTVGQTAFRATPVPPRKQEQVVVAKHTVPMTAYSSTPDQTDSSPFITASGTRTRDGVVAANFLPIGTKVRIPEYYGDKVFVVEDRMNSRYWKRMDIWMPTRSEAIQFGVRHASIEVVREI